VESAKVRSHRKSGRFGDVLVSPRHNSLLPFRGGFAPAPPHPPLGGATCSSESRRATSWGISSPLGFAWCSCGAVMPRDGVRLRASMPFDWRAMRHGALRRDHAPRAGSALCVEGARFVFLGPGPKSNTTTTTLCHFSWRVGSGKWKWKVKVESGSGKWEDESGSGKWKWKVESGSGKWKRGGPQSLRYGLGMIGKREKGARGFFHPAHPAHQQTPPPKTKKLFFLATGGSDAGRGARQRRGKVAHREAAAEKPCG